MLSVIMLIVIILSVIMLSVIMLSVIMLSVIMLCVITLSDVATLFQSTKAFYNNVHIPHLKLTVFTSKKGVNREMHFMSSLAKAPFTQTVALPIFVTSDQFCQALRLILR
jgi:hypothetical protein